MRKPDRRKMLMLVTFLMVAMAIGSAHAGGDMFHYVDIADDFLLSSGFQPNMVYSAAEKAFYLMGESDYLRSGAPRSAMAVCVSLDGQILWKHTVPYDAAGPRYRFVKAATLPNGQVATIRRGSMYYADRVENVDYNITIMDANGVLYEKQYGTESIQIFSAKGDILLSGDSDISPKGYDRYLAACDENLREKWRVVFPVDTLRIHGVADVDDGYLVYGGKGQYAHFASADGAMIAKIDANGNLDWVQVKNADASEYYAVCELADGNYLAAGIQYLEGRNWSILTKYNRHGEILSEQIFDPAEYGLFEQMTATAHGLFVAGYSNEQPIELCILQLDATGTEKKRWRSKCTMGAGFTPFGLGLFSDDNSLYMINTYRPTEGDAGPAAPNFLLVTNLHD